MLKTTPSKYDNFEGFLAFDDRTQEKRPVVLLAPTWMGVNSFIKEKAKAIAQLGYLAFVIDLFGEGREASGPDEAKALITPLVEDRIQIVKRIHLALDHVTEHPLAQAEKVAAIGFCFGGGCVLDFAKSGASIRGVVSFHGVLGNPYRLPTKPVEIASEIPASILLLHGYKDPLAPEEDLIEFQKEVSSKGADWQVIVYGDAMHAFTNPSVNFPELGMQYNPKVASRAWIAMENSLRELFA